MSFLDLWREHGTHYTIDITDLNDVRLKINKVKTKYKHSFCLSGHEKSGYFACVGLGPYMS